MSMKRKQPKEKITGAEKKQRRLLKKKRGGVVLTKDEVKAIKAGRKKLRKEMRKAGIRSKKEFELTASGLGLYFDKGRGLALLLWWWHRWGLASLLGALAALLLATFALSWLGQIRGHFTINLSDGMFREGFSLSATADFANPTSHLYATPAVDVPCISIKQIPEDVDRHDGEHNADYFAYTFYTRNEGDNSTSYRWTVALNSESLHVSTAAWVMIFEDGQMAFYAKRNADGNAEALPPMNDNTRGYSQVPTSQFLKDPDGQFQAVASRGALTYYRVIPKPYESDLVVATGEMHDVLPQEIHKYTVVIWLEGDDPDCTDELIGGHVGLEMDIRLMDEDDSFEGREEHASGDHWWDNLIWWDDLKWFGDAD